MWTLGNNPYTSTVRSHRVLPTSKWENSVWQSATERTCAKLDACHQCCTSSSTDHLILNEMRLERARLYCVRQDLSRHIESNCMSKQHDTHGMFWKELKTSIDETTNWIDEVKYDNRWRKQRIKMRHVHVTCCSRETNSNFVKWVSSNQVEYFNIDLCHCSTVQCCWLVWAMFRLDGNDRIAWILTKTSDMHLSGNCRSSCQSVHAYAIVDRWRVDKAIVDVYYSCSCFFSSTIECFTQEMNMCSEINNNRSLSKNDE
jgi:hypothetical protein